MLLAIDQGTTGTTSLVFDLQGELIGRAYREFTQHFPRPGWVEHDAAEIWEVSHAVAGEALEDAGVRPGELEAVGLTNQRETVVCWDPSTGEPLHRALVWQDRRTAARCDELREQGEEPALREKTGLILDPYFSATKIEWLLRNVDGLEQRAREGRAVFGTVDAWMLFKLTGEFATEPSNASRTLLMDIRSGRWDAGSARPVRRARARAARDPAVLRRARSHAAPTRSTATRSRSPASQATSRPRCSASAASSPGSARTPTAPAPSCWSTTARRRRRRRPACSSTVAWQIGRSTTYALEASIFVTGAAVQWLRDGLGIIEQAAETEALAKSLDSNDGVYFVPALTGLGSPHWDPYARGTVVGLTRGATRAHLARAALEAMAYQAVDAIEAMRRAGAEPLEELRADGAATVNRWLMQFQADVLGVPVVVPEIAETTAMGAALLAGVGADLLTLDQVRTLGDERARYEPRMGEDERASLLDGWHRALERSRGWAAE